MKQDVTETVIATNGNAYTINNSTKKAKKVFNSLSELKAIKNELAKNSRVSYNAYLQYLRQELPGEPIKVSKNTFTVKGYKFTFNDSSIECKDIMNFGASVVFEDLPTPKEVLMFLNNEKHKKEFSPEEMTAAAERGKKLLEDKKKVNVEKLAKVPTTQTLEEAKAKALRLIKRIKNKQSDTQKVFTDIPGMVKYRPLQTSLGIAIAMYHKRKLRWAKFLDKVESLIKNETFERKPATKIEKFIGLDHLTFKELSPEKNMPKKIPMLIIDGKEEEAGRFLCRYLLQKSVCPEIMPQLVKWIKKEITDEQFLEEPIKKDKTIQYDRSILSNLNKEQVEIITEVFYKVEEFHPYKFNYATNLKEGDKVKVYTHAYAIVEEGVVVSSVGGCWIKYEDGTYPLIVGQTFKLIK